MNKPQFQKVNDPSKVYRVGMVDKEEFDRCVVKREVASCRCDSLKMWLKLRKAGAIRVKGTRAYDRLHGGHHFWTEIKGVVYDEHGGIRQILDKNEYYKMAGIEVIESSKYGLIKEELDALSMDDPKLDLNILITYPLEGTCGWNEIVKAIKKGEK